MVALKTTKDNIIVSLCKQFTKIHRCKAGRAAENLGSQRKLCAVAHLAKLPAKEPEVASKA